MRKIHRNEEELKLEKERSLKYAKHRYESKKTEILKKQKEYRRKNIDRIKAREKEIRDSKDPERKTLQNMINRCYSKSNPSYKSYGGMGIRVCEEWRGSGGYDRFLNHVGKRPSVLHSIDRINPGLDYKPGNVRWATAKEQANNRRRTKSYYLGISEDSMMIYPYGVITTLGEFSAEVGIPFAVCQYRYARSMDPDWIINGQYDNRFYEYRGKMYSITELSLLANIPYKQMYYRINRYKMSIEDCVNKPCNNLPKPIEELVPPTPCKHCGSERYRTKDRRIRCKPCDNALQKKDYYRLRGPTRPYVKKIPLPSS